MEKIKIYVGCAVHGMQEDFLRDIELFRAGLERPNREILRFLGPEVAEPGQVYRTDIGLAKICDLLIAVRMYPSEGLAMEIQAAIDKGIAILILIPEGLDVTRMITDLPHVLPHHVVIERYRAFGEMEVIAERAIAKFFPELAPV